MYIVSILVIIILLATSIVNILAVCNVANLVSHQPPVDIMATIIMLFVALILSIFIFFSGYTLRSTDIIINIGFAPLKVKYDDILLVRTNSDKSLLFIYVETTDAKADVIDEQNNLKANIIQIFIAEKNVDDFISTVKQHNKLVPVEIITLENNKK